MSVYFQRDFLQNFNLSELVESVSEPPPSHFIIPPLLQIDFGREGERARVKDRIWKKSSNLIFSSIPSCGLHRREHNWICLYLSQKYFPIGKCNKRQYFQTFSNQISNKYQKYQTAMWRWLERGPCIFITGEENHQMAFVRSNFDNAHSNTVFLCWSSL